MARDFGKVRTVPQFEDCRTYGKGQRALYNKRARVWEKTGGHCFYCERELEFRTFEREHLRPRSRGGSNDLANQVPACQPCNVRKHNHDPVAWAASCGFSGAVEVLREMGFVA